MTADELAVWLMAHGWTTTVYTGEVVAEHPERGERRYTLTTTPGRLVGDERSYWRVERPRRAARGAPARPAGRPPVAGGSDRANPQNPGTAGSVADGSPPVPGGRVVLAGSVDETKVIR